MNHSWMV